MKSFKEQLVGTPKEIRELRVQNFLKMVSEQSKSLIEVGENGKCEYRKLQNELESLLDIMPSSSIDLSSKLSNINVSELVDNINSTTNDMLRVARIIQRRVAVHNLLFPDDTVSGLSEDELDFINDVKDLL